MVRLVLACLVVAACTPSADPDWRIELSVVGTDHSGVFAVAGRASDGSIVVAMSSPQRYWLGGHMLEGPQLARVSADGGILDIVPVDLIESSYIPTRIEVSDGGLYVVWFSGSSTVLVDYDAALTRRWYLGPSTPSRGVAESIGPHAEVAVVEDSGGPRLTVYEPDHTVRWQLALVNRSLAGFASNGDVFVLGDALERHGAADGTLIATTPIPADGATVFPDGSWLLASTEQPVQLTRYDASATQRWTVVEERGAAGWLRAADGDILVETGAPDNQLVVLDDATGARRDEAPTYLQTLFAADGEHYFGIGFAMARSQGITRFTRP